VTGERAGITTAHGSTTVTSTVAVVSLSLDFGSGLCGLGLCVNLLNGLGALVGVLRSPVVLPEIDDIL